MTHRLDGGEGVGCARHQGNQGRAKDDAAQPHQVPELGLGLGQPGLDGDVAGKGSRWRWGGKTGVARGGGGSPRNRNTSAHGATGQRPACGNGTQPQRRHTLRTSCDSQGEPAIGRGPGKVAAAHFVCGGAWAGWMDGQQRRGGETSSFPLPHQPPIPIHPPQPQTPPSQTCARRSFRPTP